MEEKKEERSMIFQENENNGKSQKYSEPELKIVEFTVVPIMADSNRCCYERGLVGYE